MATDRKFRRKNTRSAEHDAKKLFQQALAQGEVVEQGIKKAVNSQPLWRRLWDCHRIIWRCWK